MEFGGTARGQRACHEQLVVTRELKVTRQAWVRVGLTLQWHHGRQGGHSNGTQGFLGVGWNRRSHDRDTNSGSSSGVAVAVGDLKY